MKIKTKGIILAGGNGSRLFPLTKCISKQLLPVYDKPMIYYPLSVLMEAGIKEILIISTNKDLPRFKDIFSDGSGLGLQISYAEQPKPKGIAEAFIIGSDFIGNSNVCLILGDNIFYGDGFKNKLENALENLDKSYSTIFSVKVDNPKDFGVIEFNDNNMVSKIIEKPHETNSSNIVSGLYFYTNNVVKISNTINPSDRGELEITDINNHFLKHKRLRVIKLNKSFYWSDTGTYDSLIKASKFCQEYEEVTGKKISCIEEIAFRKGYISKDKFLKIANSLASSNYGKYLINKIKDLRI